MRACIQRVRQASVTANGEVSGQIGQGLLVLLGVAADDDETDIRWLANKVTGLRIFSDEAGQMNRSLLDTGGQMLVVSQFTLYGDCRKGRRPSFIEAAAPEKGEEYYKQFVSMITEQGIEVATGTFRADMDVQLINNGPVTIWIDSRQRGQ